MSNYLLISDAAKEVRVESHVLRYWEEELHLPIKRNEMGHRYYTREDVERFKQIKSMKERGLQLKAIKLIMRDGRLDVLSRENDGQENYIGTCNECKIEAEAPQSTVPYMPITIIENAEKISQTDGKNERQKQAQLMENRSREQSITLESKEDKSIRLQWLLQQLMRETLLENNQQLCRDIKESVIKELDYQFRVQEEREEERERRQDERTEEYYKKMDELLRKKSRRTVIKAEKAERKEQLEKEKREKEKLERDRLENEKRESLEREQIKQEKAEGERLEKQELEAEHLEEEKAKNKIRRESLLGRPQMASKGRKKETPKGKITSIRSIEKKAKKKRHFIF